MEWKTKKVYALFDTSDGGGIIDVYGDETQAASARIAIAKYLKTSVIFSGLEIAEFNLPSVEIKKGDAE